MKIAIVGAGVYGLQLLSSPCLLSKKIGGGMLCIKHFTPREEVMELEFLFFNHCA
jgi:hypothetical protein